MYVYIQVCLSGGIETECVPITSDIMFPSISILSPSYSNIQNIDKDRTIDLTTNSIIEISCWIQVKNSLVVNDKAMLYEEITDNDLLDLCNDQKQIISKLKNIDKIIDNEDNSLKLNHIIVVGRRARAYLWTYEHLDMVIHELSIRRSKISSSFTSSSLSHQVKVFLKSSF